MSDLEIEKMHIPFNECDQACDSKTSSDFNKEFNLIWDQLYQAISDFDDDKLNIYQTPNISKTVNVPKFNIEKEVQVIAETFKIIDIKPVQGTVCDEKISINVVTIGDQKTVSQSPEAHNINSNFQDVQDDKLSVEYVHLSNNDDYLSDFLIEKEKSHRILNKLQHNLLQSYNFLETFQSRIKDRNLCCKICENDQDLKEKMELGDERNANLFITEDINIHISSVLPYEISEPNKITTKRIISPKCNPEKRYKIKCKPSENFKKKSVRTKIKSERSACLLSLHKEENFDSSKHFATFTNFMEVHTPEQRVVDRDSIKSTLSIIEKDLQK